MTTARTMKVKDLLAVLAECDPEGEVSMWLPSWIATNEPELDLDADSHDSDDGCDYGFSFAIDANLSTAAVDANGKPDRVSIRLADDDRANVYRDRLAAARDLKAQIEEPEPLEADAEHVVVDVLVGRKTHAAMRRVTKIVNTSADVKKRACTHGMLTVQSLLGMLADDVGMVETRPGSWEASNMHAVLSSHGYNV